MKHEEISQKAIIAVTNRQLCHGDFLQQIERLAASGVAAVILREKDLSTAAYLELAQQCQQRLQHTGTALLLNRTDAARQLGIREIQLSFPFFVQQREQLQDFARVLVSVHTVEEATQAAQWGAHCILAGHIFATDCKKGIPPRGLEFLEQICTAVDIPVYAIGGITAQTFPLIQLSQAAGACVMSQAMQGKFFWVSH